MTGTMVSDAPPDVARCEDCNDEHETDALQELAHGSVCKPCAEHWHTCERCHGDVHSDNLCSHDEMLLCELCHDAIVTDCADCGDTGTREEMRIIDGHGHVCDTCSDDWFTCEHCGCDTTADYTYSIDCTTICESCYCDNVTYCHHCEEDYWIENGPQCDCESSEGEDGTVIHGYCYKPDPIFHGNPKHGAFMGVELEMEAGSGNRQGMAETVHASLADYGYLKSDSSLNNGFELVTHPASLDEHMRLMPWDVLRSVANEGARSWQAGTCGVHVHVSRDTFTKAHLGRFLWLFYNNTDQWQRLAGRTSERWAPYDDTTRCRIGKIAKRDHRPSNRYTAVNLTNAETVEVRIFRGTLNVDTLAGYISAMAAAVEYTRHASAVAVSRSGFAGLRLWAETHGETYRPFLDLVSRKVS